MVGRMLRAVVIVCLIMRMCGPALAVRCFDCVGKDCMQSFCHGDYCMQAMYAPRWGKDDWSGKNGPHTVKGCLEGQLIADNIKDHCEVAVEDINDKNSKSELISCFCDEKDCNGGKRIYELKVEPVKMLKCACKGMHCKGENTCTGELCTFVTNHRTKEVEKGCIMASIPVIERKAIGACMLPPITGAMHHNLAKTPDDLMVTESCLCDEDYCNLEKPVVTTDEQEKCTSAVEVTLSGGFPTSTTKGSCEGEYCFMVNITSDLGLMKSYHAQGCISYTTRAQLVEEMNPVGCATFKNERLNITSCFHTENEAAIQRAKSNKQREHELVDSAKFVENTDESDGKFKWQKGEEEEEEREEAEKEKEEEEEKEGKGERERPQNEQPKEKGGQEEEEEVDEKKYTQRYIYKEATEPPILEDGNTTLYAIFIVLMVIIVIAGVVWKFDLHRKIFRARYDTVAGG